MEFRRIWTLRGPNRWAQVPVIEAELCLGEADAEMADRLLRWTQALQRAIDFPADFGLVHSTTEPGFCRVVFSYDEEALGKECLQAAFALVEAMRSARPFDLEQKLAALRELAHQTRLGPSTRSIVDAARSRGIPVRRLNDGSLVQLGWGENQKRIWTAETDNTPAVAEAIAQDKQLTRQLLQEVGVPVSWGRTVESAEDACRTAEQIGFPVALKPRYGNQGRGVITNLRSSEQVAQAYEAARKISPYLIVENHLPGRDYRLLVVGERLAAAALREPAHVIGDGLRTIQQLIDEANRDPRRSDGHATALSFIKIDDIAGALLAEQGMTVESVPQPGVKVLIRRNANLSTGGTATDVTDLVHEEVAAQAVDAVRAVGLDVAGVDVVAEDISRPLAAQGGGIVEVNAGPGLRMHLAPSAGRPRDVGAAIVDNLFPAGANGRIPLVAVTGANGKTTTTRLLTHLLRSAGVFVGMTCTDGIYLNGRRTDTHDCSGPQSAHKVLLNPQVQAAVLETARGGILREGLGFDQCAVAVVTNIGKGDHLGLRGIETLEELARVKEVVVRAVAPDGWAVLNAGDPLVAGMASACPGRVVFVHPDEMHETLTKHRDLGGRVVSVRAGSIVLIERDDETVLLPLAEVPCTRGGRIAFQVENVLAASAAAWSLDLGLEAIRQGLRTYRNDSRESPGRFNVVMDGEAAIIVDYAHNPSAVMAMAAALDAFSLPRRTLVFSGCNRRDIDLIDIGKAAGDAFDRVILYRDWGRSDRLDGELNTFVRQGLRLGRRVARVEESTSERAAIELALTSVEPGAALVLGVEAIEESLAFIEDWIRSKKGPVWNPSP